MAASRATKFYFELFRFYYCTIFQFLAYCIAAAANSAHETSATMPPLDRIASSASLTSSMASPNSSSSSSLPTSSNLNVDYNFIDVEYRYGFSQV